MTLSDILADQRIVTIDGGLSTALEELGRDVSDHLWTARLLRDDPDALVAAHTRFARAGARVLITASYQASVAGFVSAGATVDEAQGLIRHSTDLARRACIDFPGTIVAASVGPYGAVLADGSEYTGDYGVTAQQLKAFHAERLELLVGSAPDLLAVETIPSVTEARILAELIAGLDVHAWISFTCGPQGRLRSGEPLVDAVHSVLAASSPAAIGVNCTEPGDVGPALDGIARETDLPLVVYPNGGGVWNGTARTWHGAGTEWIEGPMVARWIAAGARLIGGCCRVGAAAIGRLAIRVGEQQPGREDTSPA